MKTESLLTEVSSFKLSNFGQLSCAVEYGASCTIGPFN